MALLPIWAGNPAPGCAAIRLPISTARLVRCVFPNSQPPHIACAMSLCLVPSSHSPRQCHQLTIMWVKISAKAESICQCRSQGSAASIPKLCRAGRRNPFVLSVAAERRSRRAVPLCHSFNVDAAVACAARTSCSAAWVSSCAWRTLLSSGMHVHESLVVCLGTHRTLLRCGCGCHLVPDLSLFGRDGRGRHHKAN